MRTIGLSIDGVKIRVRARRDRKDGCHWWVADLRAAGFARHALGIEALPDSERAASAAAGVLLSRLRADRAASAGVAPAAAGPGLLGVCYANVQTPATGVIREWLAATRFGSPRTRQSYHWNLAAVSRALGHHAVAEFAPPAGSALLLAWRDEARARGLSAHTVQHQTDALFRVLSFACSRKWLRELPERPPATIYDGEVVYQPTCRPVLQAHYEAALAELLPRVRADAAAGDAAAADRLARVLLWLTFVRYTGAHPEDADTLEGGHVSPLAGTFLRRNRKNRRVVKPIWIAMPSTLAAAMRREFARRQIARNELVMGKFHHPERYIAEACARAGVPAWTPTDLRCTVATECCRAGWRIEATRALMGHASSKMVEEVYAQVEAAEISHGMEAIGAGALEAPVVPLLAFPTGDAEARKGPHAAPSVPSAGQLRAKRQRKQGG